MIRTIIVDDEMPAREELKYLLEEYKEIEVIDEVPNGVEALKVNRELKPDLIFLDIQMPQINGLEVAEQILESRDVPLIVFVTAYDEFAVKAFEVNAVDYLLKPLSSERLKKSVTKILQQYTQNKDAYADRLQQVLKGFGHKDNRVNKISVSKGDKIVPIFFKDIIYATVEDRNTIIVTAKGKFYYSDTLSHLEDELSDISFFRSHRSYIINIDYITEIEPWFNCTYQVRMKDSDELVPVSRNKVKEFKALLNIK